MIGGVVCVVVYVVIMFVGIVVVDAAGVLDCWRVCGCSHWCCCVICRCWS